MNKIKNPLLFKTYNNTTMIPMTIRWWRWWWWCERMFTSKKGKPAPLPLYVHDYYGTVVHLTLAQTRLRLHIRDVFWREGSSILNEGESVSLKKYNFQERADWFGNLDEIERYDDRQLCHHHRHQSGALLNTCERIWSLAALKGCVLRLLNEKPFKVGNGCNFNSNKSKKMCFSFYF